MRRFPALVVALLAAMPLWARNIAFELDAFNAVCPANTASNMVFSPASFEIDCAVIAESLDTISRANVAETIGVMVDLETSFSELQDELLMRTNGFSMVAARAFLVPNMRLSMPSYRAVLHRSYHAAVCPSFPAKGAEAWLAAETEYRIPDFRIPMPTTRADNRFSFCDVVSVSASWKERFPTNETQRRVFTTPSGGKIAMHFMTDVRTADIWRSKFFSVLRLPMRGDAEFYAMIPRGNGNLYDIRGDLTPLTVDRVIAAVSSQTEKGSFHGMARISLPLFDFNDTVEFTDLLLHYKIPTRDLRYAAGKLLSRTFVQRVCFSLKEQGEDEEPLAAREQSEDEPARVAAEELILDKPFLFFIRHKTTQTLPIMGVFTGQ